MVEALTSHYGGHAMGSKGQLRRRIAELERTVSGLNGQVYSLELSLDEVYRQLPRGE